MRPAGAIFDLDGTLIDSMYLWDYLPDALVRRFGATPRPGLSHALREMSTPQAADYLISVYRLPASPRQLMDALEELSDREYREKIPIKPGARELLDQLKGLGVPCALATASQTGQARAALERLGLAPFFRGIFSTEDYGPKSRPEIYLQAARALGAPPKDTLVFEDSLHAARTAAGAGFQVAGVYDPFSAEDSQAMGQVCRWYLPRLDDREFWEELGIRN